MLDTRSAPLESSCLTSAQHPSCAVLVMSCDAYRDLWTPFFALFWRYWPDCPFPVYLGTNEKTFGHPRVMSLPAGDYPWSKCLKRNLEQINADYVLLLLEDYFFTEPISTGAITHSLCSLAQVGGTLLRLYPLPGPDEAVDGYETFGRIHRQASYRVSTQAAIWRKSGLLDLVREDENIWDFEWKGSVRSQAQAEDFFATYRALMPYRQVVERGKWFRSAAKHFAKQQIGCDFTARPVMSSATEARKALKGRTKHLLDRVLPASLRFRT